MKFRDEIANDREAIYGVIAEAFGQTDEAALVNALRTSGDSKFALVAEDNGAIVGHVLFSQLQAPTACLALAPVSVLPARQSQGVGSMLITEGLARATAAGWQAIFLLGDPGYYQRFGFRVAAADKFVTSYPKSHFMALELVPGALDRLSGEVVYPPPFLALD